MYRVFVGYTGLPAELGVLATNLLVIAPIQITVFLANSAIVEGARTKEIILRIMKGDLALVLGVTWVTSPTTIIFAQTFLPPEVRGSRSIWLLHRDLPFGVVLSSVLPSGPVLHRVRASPTLITPFPSANPPRTQLIFNPAATKATLAAQEKDTKKD